MKTFALSLLALAACTDTAPVDLSHADVDIDLASPSPGGNPGNFQLPLPDCTNITAAFDGLPGVVTPECDVYAPKMPSGAAMLVTMNDSARMLIAEPFAARTVAWEQTDGKLATGDTAAITWTPPTDILDAATVTCFDSDRPVFTAMTTTARPTGAIPLAVDGARLSFVVPDVRVRALTCLVAATVRPQIVTCEGLGSCSAEIAQPAGLVLQATIQPTSSSTDVPMSIATEAKASRS